MKPDDEHCAPVVSAIIPTYNCQAYIEQTVSGILAQSYQDFEVIVVDDGSRDRTCDIVRRMIREVDPRIRLIEQSNAGVCRARNRGIQEARGRFICLLDHDDYWFPHKLEQQVRTLEGRPEVGVVYANFLNWHPAAEGYAEPASFDSGEEGNDSIDGDFSGWIYHQFLLDCWMLTSTAMFRQSVFSDCGTFDEGLPYSEDWDLWLRISRKHQFIKFTRPNTLYRQHRLQGNRVVRPVDYRTRLLTAAVRRWGMCSPDGRCVERSAFLHRLSTYHLEYGFMHLKANHRVAAIAAMLKAFAATPTRARIPAYIVATAVGWKPRW